jgi:hypothetical protein
MRIIRQPGLSAVVAVKGPGVNAIAIPDGIPVEEVMELASLVLTSGEYQQVRHEMEVRSEGSWRPSQVRH